MSRRTAGRRRLIAAAGLVLALGSACAKPRPEAARRDTLTTRERQERIGTMPIPGAAGVTRALGAQDSGASRARQIDSIAEEH